MSKPLRLGSAASLAALASMIAGCAAPHQATGFGGQAQGEIGLATRALAALSSNDVPTAISFAEKAVEKTPDDAGFRGLLGNAYFAGGRFWSAEQAYKDALSIYDNQPRVILKLALVEIALGKSDQAVRYLQAGQGSLDAADYGLAMALAGRTDDALAVLKAAARDRAADSRVRQNLALALALSGDWTNARTIAAQDVPAGQLDARVQQWMQLAKPGKPSDQVASLVGVTMAARDQGQPVRLALVKPDTRLAQAAPVAVPSPATAPTREPAPVNVAQVPPPQPQQLLPVNVAQGPQPVLIPALSPQPQFADAPIAPPAPPPANPERVAARPEPIAPVVAAKAASVAPLTMALIAAAAPEAPSAFAAFMPKKRAAVPKPAKARAAAPKLALRHGNSNNVVQLGAYRSPQAVSAAWNGLTQRYPALRAYLPLRARFDSPKGTFWRLAIQGFNNRGEAVSRCELLKSHGGKCFVRSFAGDAPVQYASR
ncbi:MAG TPA: SPOR domain-containing protein [Sphingomicrobium sp.]|nr:SPOR domain-containing protein [Sphingomicrobium sp.]